MKLKLENIRIDGGTQPRKDINEEIVSEYESTLSKYSPKSIFKEYTYVDANTAKAIKNVCMDKDAIPIIEHHEEYGLVFHSLDMLSQGISKKEIAKQFEPEEYRGGPERTVEDRLCDWLENKGVQYQRQLKLRSGIADVVTDDYVFEVKSSLKRGKLFKAIGQVLVYNESLGGERLPVIVGDKNSEIDLNEQLVKRVGIKIMVV